MKRKIFLIGSGNRIINNFLPALRCLEDKFEIIGIHSRTANNCITVAEKWDIKPILELTSEVLKDADIIGISVTTKNVITVLEKLRKLGFNKSILLDTPVCSFKYFSELSILQSFKKVYVAEDFAHFPRFQIIRDDIEKNKDEIIDISINTFAYGYHAAALLRSFFKNELPVKINTSNNNKKTKFNFNFKKNKTGSFTHPYDSKNGSIWVSCKNNSYSFNLIDDKIVNFETKSTRRVSLNGNTYYLLSDEGVLIRSLHMSFFDKILSMPIEDRSDFNIEKTHSLINIFKNIYDDAEIIQYTFQQGIFDSLVESMGKVPGNYYMPTFLNYTESLAGWILYKALRLKNKFFKLRFK